MSVLLMLHNPSCAGAGVAEELDQCPLDIGCNHLLPVPPLSWPGHNSLTSWELHFETRAEVPRCLLLLMGSSVETLASDGTLG